MLVLSVPAVVMMGAEERIVRMLVSMRSLFWSSTTMSIETVAWRFWTRVTRARTIESTAGRVLNFRGDLACCCLCVGLGVSVCGERDTVRILRGLRFGSVPLSSVLRITGPAMEAQIEESRTYVPGPEVNVELSPRRSPGTAMEGILAAIS